MKKLSLVVSALALTFSVAAEAHKHKNHEVHAFKCTGASFGEESVFVNPAKGVVHFKGKDPKGETVKLEKVGEGFKGKATEGEFTVTPSGADYKVEFKLDGKEETETCVPVAQEKVKKHQHHHNDGKGAPKTGAKK